MTHPYSSLRLLAYDGKGNHNVKTADAAASLLMKLSALGEYDHNLNAEKWAPFVKELAVMVVRYSLLGLLAQSNLAVKCDARLIIYK